MSQMRKLFRPGAGQTIRWFTAAFVEATTYPHDWVNLSGTATSGQGPGGDGVLEGKTLGTNDFVYVELADSANNGVPGTELGVVMGSGIGAVANTADVSGDSVAADNMVVIQQFGVHPVVATDGNASVTAEYLTIGTAAGIADAASGEGASTFTNVGIALGTDAAYTRAVAATGGVAWIRCV